MREKGYLYDGNRLQSVEDAVGLSNYIDAEDFQNRTSVSSEYAYDANGNVTLDSPTLAQGLALCQLSKKHPLVKKSYLYTCDRLASVEDAIPVASFTDAEDFQNKASLATEYGYDANGNITIDANSGYTIAYNHLNKPTQILELATNNVINMIYSTDGTKLRQTTYTNGQAAQVMDYSTGYIYKQRELQYFSHEEGRCLRTSTTTPDAAVPNVHLFRYEYNLTDHLGNVRISFSDTDSDGKAEVLQEQHYEAYGLRLGGLVFQDGEENRFTYSGKERIGELGLGWSDFGARMYNPAIGRWNGVDAMAEKYGNMTPYMYVAGNTIRLTDIDGRDIIDGDGNPMSYTKKNGVVTWSENTTQFVKRVGNIMLSTKRGTKALDRMISAKDKYSLLENTTKLNYAFGEHSTSVPDADGVRTHTITIFTGAITDKVNKVKNNKGLVGRTTSKKGEGQTSALQAAEMTTIMRYGEDPVYMIAAGVVAHEEEHGQPSNAFNKDYDQSEEVLPEDAESSVYREIIDAIPNGNNEMNKIQPFIDLDGKNPSKDVPLYHSVPKKVQVKPFEMQNIGDGGQAPH